MADGAAKPVFSIRHPDFRGDAYQIVGPTGVFWSSYSLQACETRMRDLERAYQLGLAHGLAALKKGGV